jgi:hypothetical protein
MAEGVGDVAQRDHDDASWAPSSPLASLAKPSCGDQCLVQRPEQLSRDQQKTFVTVAIRVKPAAANTPDTQVAVWSETRGDSHVVCLNRGYILEEYEFPHVISPTDDNQALFDYLQGSTLAESVCSGVNETLFAYGPTGSGKTHTIFGARREPGLLGFFVSSIFDQATHNIPGSTVHLCCYEVVGDTLTDLLDTTDFVEQGLLQAADIVYDEIFLKTYKCKYQIVCADGPDACMRLLDGARANRTAGVSSANATSSRSHAVVQIFVQNPNARAGSASVGALTLVDLAGAERENENPSVNGQKTARLLNTSLSSLNRLLRKLQTGSLGESERRQSVLNKCLWDYLRPGCGIGLIFCVSPLWEHRGLSLSTLAMATDSRLIRSRRKSQFIKIPPPQPSAQRPPLPPRSSAGAAVPRGVATPRMSSAGAPSSCSLPSTPRSSKSGVDWGSKSGDSPRHETPTFDSGAMASRGRACPAKLTAASLGSSSRASSVGSSTMRWEGSASIHAVNLTRAAGRGGRKEGGVQPSTPRRRKEEGGGRPEHPREESDPRRLERQLARERAKSQERISHVELERDNLSSENRALQCECDSLRALFIQQQRQQLAFWSAAVSEPLAGGALRPPSAVGDTCNDMHRDDDIEECEYDTPVRTKTTVQLSSEFPPRPVSLRDAAVAAAVQLASAPPASYQIDPCSHGSLHAASASPIAPPETAATADKIDRRGRGASFWSRRHRSRHGGGDFDGDADVGASADGASAGGTADSELSTACTASPSSSVHGGYNNTSNNGSRRATGALLRASFAR